jgi:hypothetical protein
MFALRIKQNVLHVGMIYIVILINVMNTVCGGPYDS